MAKRQIIEVDPRPSDRSKIDPANHEQYMISIAMKLAEERILNKTASSQEIVHFLRLGTENARLEREKLRSENKLINAKAEQIESIKKVDELYKEAIKAFTTYSGGDVVEDEES